VNSQWTAPTHAFVTLFDRHYAARGVLLARSLGAHLPGATLYVVCLDSDTRRLLEAQALSGVRLIALSAIEAFDPRLQAIKSSRATIEYYYTLSPALPRFLLAREPGLERVTYLDADLYFFGDPSAALESVSDASISAIEHRYSSLWDGTAQCGRFNVGLLSFKRSAEASACLERWQTQCIEQCPDHNDSSHAYGDQLYLNEWPARYPNFAVIHHPGANLAPWNVRTHTLKPSALGLLVDGKPLLFFHFHGLRQMARGVWNLSLEVFNTRLDRVLKRHIYRPYLQALEAQIDAVDSFFGARIATSARDQHAPAEPNLLLRLKFLKRAWKGQYLII